MGRWLASRWDGRKEGDYTECDVSVVSSVESFLSLDIPSLDCTTMLVESLFEERTMRREKRREAEKGGRRKKNQHLTNLFPSPTSPFVNTAFS
jgi:hypothetical protein